MIKVNLAKLFAVLLMLIFLAPFAKAKKVDSYIITNNNDTIYGTIRLSRFNLFQKTISLNSYHMEELFDHVFFKSSTDKKFKELFPNDALEYGFILERTKYRYISKEIEPTWGRKRKFYLQIINGAIDLYEIQTFLDTRHGNLNPYGMRIAEYFILGEDKNLIKVSKNNKDELVSDFLMKYLTLDKEILAEVAKDKTYKDIKEIARLYNEHFDILAKP